MAIATYINVNCAEIAPGFGVTLNIHGSDMDASRLVVFDSLMNPVGIKILSFSPIFMEVALATGAPGFLNGNYFVGFSPYETEVFTVMVACPLSDFSGLLIVDQMAQTRRDTYIEAETKIPDPTIRTALLGE